MLRLPIDFRVCAFAALALLVAGPAWGQTDPGDQQQAEASGADCLKPLPGLSLTDSLAGQMNQPLGYRGRFHGDIPDDRVFGMLTIHFDGGVMQLSPATAGFEQAARAYVAAKNAGNTAEQNAVRTVMDNYVASLQQALIDARVEGSPSARSATGIEERLGEVILAYDQATGSPPRGWEYVDARQQPLEQTGLCPSLPAGLPAYAAAILETHNAERAIAGAPPLTWDPALADRMIAWAQEMAGRGELVHSPREGRGTVRENLARIPSGWDVDQAIKLWIDEKTNFVPGVFPDVSRTGQVDDVLHYTQMIWFGTISIGCGKATGGGFDWWACGYGPGGNRPGEWVGLNDAEDDDPSLEEPQQDADADEESGPAPQWFVDLTDLQGQYTYAADTFRAAQQTNDQAKMKTWLDILVQIAKSYTEVWSIADREGWGVEPFVKPDVMNRTIEQFWGAIDTPTGVQPPQLPGKEVFKPEPPTEPLPVL